MIYGKLKSHGRPLHGPLCMLWRRFSVIVATPIILLLICSSAPVYSQNWIEGESESKTTEPVVLAQGHGTVAQAHSTVTFPTENTPGPNVMPLPPANQSTTIVPAPATEPKIFRVTISKQPLSTFVAVLGSKISGVAAYSSTTCSRLHESVTFSDDLIKQFVEEHELPVVDYLGAKATAQAARRNSKQHKIFAVTSEIATDASLVIAANFIHANPATTAGKLLRLAPIIIGTKAEQAKDALTAELPPVDVIFAGRILNGSDVTIQPGKCATRLFLGVHEKTISIRTISGDLVL